MLDSDGSQPVKKKKRKEKKKGKKEREKKRRQEGKAASGSAGQWLPASKQGRDKLGEVDPAGQIREEGQRGEYVKKRPEK